jgi:hypothetical protein
MNGHHGAPPYQQPSGAEMTDPAVWTVERIRALGATTPLAMAAAVLGVSRSHAYRLAATDAFPAPVIRVGNRVVVPVAGLLRLVLLDDDESEPGADDQRLDRRGETSVDTPTTPPAGFAPCQCWRRCRVPHDEGDDR